MKERANAYIIIVIILLLAVLGGWAVLHASDGAAMSSVKGAQAKYSNLQKSILSKP